MNDDRRLKAALSELEARSKDQGKAAKKALDHRIVRDVLLGIGGSILADEDGDPETYVPDALPAAIERLGKRFDDALASEMQLACNEHILGVDPRYLSHPRYDFGYALGARERLEARLVTLEALGLPVDPELLEGVAAADERLEEALASRADEAGSGPSAKSPPKGS